MMRLIDQYAIWQKGYALEWERRVRETLLPQYREAIAPHIIAFYGILYKNTKGDTTKNSRGKI